MEKSLVAKGITKLAEVLNRVLAPMNIRISKLKVVQPIANSLESGKAYLNEEGVLTELRDRVTLTNTWYVDLGAADGVTGSNTVHLLKQGWQGLCVEGDLLNVAKMTSLYHKQQNVFVCHAWITPDNIISLLETYNVPKDVAVLSLDIDSYDFFVLEALTAVYRPSIIIAEINERIPPPIAFTVNYPAPTPWKRDSFFGMSLQQAGLFADKHGYGIVHLEYNNVFLVDLQRYNGKVCTVKEAYVEGYKNKSDRLIKFPYNDEFEYLQNAPEAELEGLVHTMFAAYKEAYTLTTVKD